MEEEVLHLSRRNGNQWTARYYVAVILVSGKGSLAKENWISDHIEWEGV